MSGIAFAGCCKSPKIIPSTPRPCATEPLPPLPDIDPSEIAGPNEGCDPKWELCLAPRTARKLEKYHSELRRAAETNARLCSKSVARTAE